MWSRQTAEVPAGHLLPAQVGIPTACDPKTAIVEYFNSVAC
jgi:hypothetical protein